MSDPADFLNRWSRRKRAVAEGRVEADETKTPEKAPEARASPVELNARSESRDAEPAFDISKLPSLESIGPKTDVSLFLQPGVPSALRHAALRRAWVTDPAIRDFRAPQELDWDFNAPGLPGFGEIGPDIDVKKMAARILGGASPDEQPQETAQAPSIDESGPVVTSSQPLPRTPDDKSNATDEQRTHPKDDIALQQDEAVQPARIRRHGGAMPE